MARVFAYLMGNDLDKIEDEVIFKDTSDTIKNALQKHLKLNQKSISKTAFDIALNQLV